MILKNNKPLKENKFKNEKELQHYFEKNIDDILGVEFLASEFIVGDFRIDTLAFDENTKSFHIIEYKNIKNRSLIDQGYTYLKLMLERKADFVLKYNIEKGKNLNVNDIDWSQSRLIFVSVSFTSYQLNATDFSNIAIDLYKVNRYAYDIVSIQKIKKTSKVKVEQVNNDKEIKKVSKEIKLYDEQDQLNNKSEEIVSVYEYLKSKILELDDIEVVPRKHYISFKKNFTVCDVITYKTKLIVYINLKKGEINNLPKEFIDYTNKGHWGQGNYYIVLKNIDEVDLAIPYIKRAIR